MTKKDYLVPSVEVIEMGYRDPVCQAASGNEDAIPDYDVLDLGADFFDLI